MIVCKHTRKVNNYKVLFQIYANNAALIIVVACILVCVSV